MLNLVLILMSKRALIVVNTLVFLDLFIALLAARPLNILLRSSSNVVSLLSLTHLTKSIYSYKDQLGVKRTLIALKNVLTASTLSTSRSLISFALLYTLN